MNCIGIFLASRRLLADYACAVLQTRKTKASKVGILGKQFAVNPIMSFSVKIEQSYVVKSIITFSLFRLRDSYEHTPCLDWDLGGAKLEVYLACTRRHIVDKGRSYLPGVMSAHIGLYSAHVGMGLGTVFTWSYLGPYIAHPSSDSGIKFDPEWTVLTRSYLGRYSPPLPRLWDKMRSRMNRPHTELYRPL